MGNLCNGDRPKLERTDSHYNIENGRVREKTITLSYWRNKYDEIKATFRTTTSPRDPEGGSGGRGVLK